MLGGNLQQHFRRAGGLAPALFPVLERIFADAQKGGKLGLRQPQLAASPDDAVVRGDVKHAAWFEVTALDGFRLLHALEQFIKQLFLHGCNWLFATATYAIGGWCQTQ